jgi:hypothetical protein
MRTPIARPLAYAASEPFDLIINQFTRHHLHFFHEAGLSHARWLPSFTLTPFDHELQGFSRRARGVTFVGGINHHPYRRAVLEFLASRPPPPAPTPPSALQSPQPLPPGWIQVLSASQSQTAAIAADSRTSLNISLNGDLNLRTFETLAAGGLLVADRLSPESGQELLFENRRHMLLFDQPEELLTLLPYYLAHPEEAEAIAAAGQERYRAHYTPARLRKRLFELLAGDCPDPHEGLDLRAALPPPPRAAGDAPSLQARIALYEFLQELHRNNPRLNTLFWQGAARHAADAIDLPRLHVGLLHDPSAHALLCACRLESRVQWVDPAAPALPPPHRSGAPAAGDPWHLLICPGAALATPGINQLLHARLCRLLLLTDTPDLQTLQKAVDTCQLKKISDTPLAFSLPL